MLLIFSVKIMFEILEELNKPLEIDVIPLPTITVFRYLQPEKAPSPILTSESGRVILTRRVFTNANPPIDFNFELNVILFNFTPEKNLSGIDVIFSGTTNEVIFLLNSKTKEAFPFVYNTDTFQQTQALLISSILNTKMMSQKISQQ